jgi:hypothetical protein
MEARSTIAKALDLDTQFAANYAKFKNAERQLQARKIISLYLDGAEKLKSEQKNPSA